MMAILDNFSGAASDLPKGKRTAGEVLAVLAKHPRVSTWDMSEHAWLRGLIEEMIRDGLIVEVAQHYPWHRYKVVEQDKEA